MVREDLYQKVTNTIVAELERGVAPWVRPWKTLSGQFGGGPYNGYTARGYRGINVLLLFVASAKKGYQDSRWFTYRQAKTLGAQVTKGEESTTVIFWKQHQFQQRNVETDTVEVKRVPMLRSYAVFNAEQCEGIAALPKTERPLVALRYQQAQVLFEKHAVDVRFGGDEAFFVPDLDYIQMPHIEAFVDEEQYWSTKLHELTHWTGHRKRLDRDLSGRFRSNAYAAEELVAEMGAAFLCASLGIEGMLRHPQYIAKWLTVLKQDKRAVFNAASHAQAAADFVLGREEIDPEPSEAAEGPTAAP